MFSIFTNIARWLFSKAAMLLVLWMVVLGAVAVYLASQRYLEKLPDQLRKKQAQVTAYREQLSAMDDKVAAIEARMKQQIAKHKADREKADNAPLSQMPGLKLKGKRPGLR